MDLHGPYGLPGNPPGGPDRADVATGHSSLTSALAAVSSGKPPDPRSVGAITLRDQWQ